MARKLKFREPTDVVSVRLPISLIERLDSLCESMRLGRADFIAAILRHYPKMPSPERARVWLANLAWVVVGGGTALLAAWHGGSAFLDEGLTPARRVGQPGIQLESGAPSAPAPTVLAPMLPPRDLRLEPTWRPGNLQGLIPRRERPEPETYPVPEAAAPERRSSP
jgi:hypothetical protein